MWVQFWDMHSGGKTKTQYHMIYIEAHDRKEAIGIFESRFNRSPFNITCSCCGEDYSIDSHDSIYEITGYHRNCRAISFDGRQHIPGKTRCYIENDEEIPEGATVCRSFNSYGEYMTLEEYMKLPDVLILPKHEIGKTQ